MVDGQTGLHGARVPRNAEVELRFEQGHVTRPCPNMAVPNARETTTKLYCATHDGVQVNLSIISRARVGYNHLISNKRG